MSGLFGDDDERERRVAVRAAALRAERRAALVPLHDLPCPACGGRWLISRYDKERGYFDDPRHLSQVYFRHLDPGDTGDRPDADLGYAMDAWHLRAEYGDDPLRALVEVYQHRRHGRPAVPRPRR